MFNFMMTATFKDIEVTSQIGVCVGMRIFNGIPDTSLSAKMDNALEFLLIEQ